jgi:hypothetical protein
MWWQQRGGRPQCLGMCAFALPDCSTEQAPSINDSHGSVMGLQWRSQPRAAEEVQSKRVMRAAHTIVGDRVRPLMQCTSTLPPSLERNVRKISSSTHTSPRDNAKPRRGRPWVVRERQREASQAVARIWPPPWPPPPLGLTELPELAHHSSSCSSASPYPASGPPWLASDRVVGSGFQAADGEQCDPRADDVQAGRRTCFAATLAQERQASSTPFMPSPKSAGIEQN